MDIKKERIYKHTHLNQADADRLKPLMENAFSGKFEQMRSSGRSNIAEERLRFATEQYANRARISSIMGVSPLNEDANIFESFKTFIPNMNNLFESAASIPGNTIGMGSVVNPMEGNKLPGGMWNPGYKAGSGDIPSYVFGLQNEVALNCIGFDLIPTIAVDTPVVQIGYIDTVYGGGSFDDAENPLHYIELAHPYFTPTNMKAVAVKRGTEFVIKNATHAVKLKMTVLSTLKTAANVEVVSTGKVATDIATFDNSVSIKAVVDSLNENGGVKITVGSTNTEITTTGTWKAGYISATRTNIAEAASNNSSLGGMERSQQEKGAKHKLNVIAMNKQLEMVGIEIDSDTSNIQIKDMAAMGVNVISYLYTGVQNQIVQTLDEIILDHLYALGVEHAINAYSTQGINHSLYIDNPSNTTKAYTDFDFELTDMAGNDRKADFGSIKNSLVSAGYENQSTHGERLYARILLISEFVAQQNRTAPVDFVVAPGEIAATLKKQSKYTVNPVSSTLSNSPELSYSGTIFDTINVYKNVKVSFNDPRVLFGRRGNDMDSGAKFLAYDLAASRQIIAEGTMAEKIRVWSRFNIADIGFYPELNYYLALFVNGYGWA